MAQAATTMRHMSDSKTFELGEDSYKTYNLDMEPSPTVSATKEECMEYLRKMMVIRRMETAAGDMYRGKKIRGFCHLYSGQEAVATGMNAGLIKEDAIVGAYRIHGWAYLMGCQVKQVMGELFGTSVGCSAGKGGSMHMYAENFYGGNGIVGAQVPLGAGLAFSNKYLDNGTVAVTLYGDGAANQGQVFESYNIAKLWDLPCLFVCENNKFGMGTSASRSSANPEYYKRCEYIPGLWVNGMDVLAVKEATRFAREYALTNGPMVIEMETYRYHGHSMSDPDTTYRTRDDIADVRKKMDPILILRSRIVEAGWAEESELKAMEKKIRKEVDAEVQEALKAPEPNLNMLTEHILLEKPSDIRGCDITISY